MQEFPETFGKVQVFESDGTFSSTFLIIEPGKGLPKHHHKKMKEVVIVMEGEIVYDGKVKKPHDTIIQEPGTTHSIKNETDSNVKVLFINIPPYNSRDVFEEK